MKLDKSSTLRLLFSIWVAIIFQLCFCLLPSFGLQAVAGILTLLIYFIPMIYNLIFIKNYEITGVKSILKKDFFIQIIPSVLTAIFTECIIILFGKQPLPGLSTLIFIAAALIITAVFWLMYLIYNNYYKPQ